MTDEQQEITRHMSVLVGLEVSGVHHAADMLTMQFGPLRPRTTFRGVAVQVGAWALHVQCGWCVEHKGKIVVDVSGLRGSADLTARTIDQLGSLLVGPPPATVEGISINASGDMSITWSKTLRLIVTPDGMSGEEDWRLFAPGDNGNHFVIIGGKIDPDSLT
ncbi:hypothetical protein [Paraburkholderia flava]|uniref:hypothetical protein n=1 Tax=Paraburkholderia flava TaxID=2547393 RepID=UPI0010610B71|nr:hypothetical protein [Paraburkholderia flava]